MTEIIDYQEIATSLFQHMTDCVKVTIGLAQVHIAKDLKKSLIYHYKVDFITPYDNIHNARKVMDNWIFL